MTWLFGARPGHAGEGAEARGYGTCQAALVQVRFLPFVLFAGCAASHGLPDAGVARDVLPACPADAGTPHEGAVTDTLGWTVWFTHYDGPCGRPQMDGELPHPVACPPRQMSDGTISWSGRVLIVEPRCRSSYREVWPRPVVCESDADCEPALDWLDQLWDPPDLPSRTACIRGLCQFPEQPITADDVRALCLADVPRWVDFATGRTPESGHRELESLVWAACGRDDCLVPPECRQP